MPSCRFAFRGKNRPQMKPAAPQGESRPLRLWPAWGILAVTAIAVLGVQSWSDWPFQRRNLTSMSIAAIGGALLVLWWLFLSRAAIRSRLAVLGVLILAGLGLKQTVRIRGVTGDLIPILEWRGSEARVHTASEATEAARKPGDYPQFLGPDRTGILRGPAPSLDWKAHGPKELWRVPVGAAWSGFAVVGNRAITLEQVGDSERVVCRNLLTGRETWSTTNSGRYATPIGGEGPRSTPTVAGSRVFTQGAAGWLQALDLESGRRLWGTNILELASASVPEWGLAGSPLVVGNRVLAHAGGKSGRSLLVFDAERGELLASGGDDSANYGSPALLELAGVPQVVVFNGRAITAHSPESAAVLWTRPWGIGYPLVANPVAVSSNRFLVTAGYAVGAELIEVNRGADGRLVPSTVWSSKRLKAKFANPVRLGTLAVGLDDGILAAIDLADGSQKWKSGRYGHGQGAWIGGVLLQMTEEGELAALEPDATGPNERARLKVFDHKTWNPIAVAGDLLVARTDREAACFRLPPSQGR